MRFLSLACVALCLALTGCGYFANPIPKLITTQAAKEKEIAALRADYATAMENLRQRETAKTQEIVTDKDAQMHRAGVGLYAADLTFRGILQPTRTDLIVNGYVTEAWTALGKPMPTAAEMEAANQRLKDELDEAKTSLAQLKKNHEEALANNQVLADVTARHAKELIVLAEERRTKEAAFHAALDKLQVELDTANKKLIAAERARSDDAAARQAQLAKLSWGAGILAALCLAGAIWSPVFKHELGIGAVVLAGAAVAIPFIEGWMILTTVGVAVAAVIVWVVLKHRKEERVADALSLAFQDLKEKGGEIAAAAENAATDRLARYRKVGGKLVTEKDYTLAAHIDSKLAEYDVLPAQTQ